MADFDNLIANLHLIIKEENHHIPDDEEAVKIFCLDCDFYRDDERTLACSCLKVLKRLLATGAISLEEVLRAVEE